jgi:hypothetical protein
MPKVSRQSAEVEDHGPVEDRHAEFEGYTVNFVTFRQEMDGTAVLKGLPDDRCQCPHWGYVFKGRLTFRFADREESYERGDAFYAPPGHIPVHAADTEYLQFSPSEELHQTSEVIMKNMREIQGQPEAPE